ncbi:P-type conjugative transfer protein TrbL [Caulobacter sp. AP07]|uniref:P-type conjugative transfer protein TrbL n=1 Tax=Caulobacter sp. AP07 TaxID=1144304 RepID=UPI00027225BF|nr:P-type conjugative transfer protein TrbL [Caulobacter sp. AP07]EJL24478.1 P-type conjugative transfer protein TrbL [Caulobacter sp. AP07]
MGDDGGAIDLNIVDRFLDTFIRYIDGGFGLLGSDVTFLTTVLIGIDVTLAALWWAMDGDQDILGRLIKKTLYVGAFAFIIGNFRHLADIIYRSFSGLGITAGGGGISADQMMRPGAIAGEGFSAAWPLLKKAGSLLGFPEFFGNFLVIAVLLVCWLLVLLAFFVLALQLFVTIIEFKLTTLAGFVLVPFALWNKTSFLAERVLGNVISSGVKVMVLAVIVGIGTSFFGQFSALAGDDPGVKEAVTLLIGALALFGLGVFGPGIASGLVSGAPQLGAGAAVGTMAGAAMIGMGGAALGARALGAVGGGLGAVRAASAMGTTAKTAYQSAAFTSGQSGPAAAAAGLGGVARAAASVGEAASRQASSFADKAAEAFSQGQAWRMPDRSSQSADGEAAGSAGPPGGQAATSSTSPDAPPAWATQLRREQTARHHRHAAIQLIKDGDRPGGAANPDLSQKD